MNTILVTFSDGRTQRFFPMKHPSSRESALEWALTALYESPHAVAATGTLAGEPACFERHDGDWIEV